ncbi:unnamed protein product [Oreochromis niloticus]|nr:unnamed protein product [Mustela putorius furo]
MEGSQRPQFICGLRYITIGLTLFFLYFIFIGQGMVGSGAFDCPRQPFISLYMSLFGIIPVFLALSLWCNWCNGVCWSVTTIFFCCWFIAGSIVIYSIYEPKYDKTTAQPDLYCNKTLYLFAFWFTNMTYILLALIFLSYCCCRQRGDGDNETQTLVR